MDITDSRFAPSPDAASDDSASHFHPPARDGRDRLDFEPVPLRYRTDGLTPQKQREYVEALADTGVCRQAAARIGISEQAINRVRRRADAFDFDRACEAAHLFGARRLRSIAFERAIEGTLKGHYYRGERVGEERVFDNRLLIYLLGKVEHLLQPDDDARAVADNWDSCMDALEQGLPAPERIFEDEDEGEEPLEPGSDERCHCDEDGIWWTCFPPPAGFEGEEVGELGDSHYKRVLTAEEQAAAVAREAADDEAEIARCCGIRDRYFGLPPRGAAGCSVPGEAETPETSGPPAPSVSPSDPAEAPASPSSVRRPGSMSADALHPEDPCSWIPDQVRDDDDAAPSSPRRGPEPETTAGRSMDDEVRDDEEESDDSGSPHIQIPPSRHPAY